LRASGAVRVRGATEHVDGTLELRREDQSAEVFVLAVLEVLLLRIGGPVARGERVLAGDHDVELDRLRPEDLVLEVVARRGPGADDDLGLVLFQRRGRVLVLDVVREVDRVAPRMVVGGGDVDALLS
jgi:hypothetical protein